MWGYLVDDQEVVYAGAAGQHDVTRRDDGLGQDVAELLSYDACIRLIVQAAVVGELWVVVVLDHT